jgi:hypothetical protein
MKNTYAVFQMGNEYTCVQFFDIDTQTDGVDVYNAADNKHIGEIWGVTIPEVDAELVETQMFEGIVTEWLNNNL